MCGRTILIEERFTCKYDHVFVAGLIRVEVQRDPGILFDMSHLMRVWFAEDQKRILFPNKPDGTWLRCEI